MQKVTVFLGLLLSLSSVSHAADIPQVFQIVADDCSLAPRRVQTGFLLSGYNGLITALHGVLDCNTITARRTGDDPDIKGLKIVEVDVERDVALLTSPSLRKSIATGLPIGPTPSLGAKLFVVGHPQALLGQHRTSLTVESLDKYLEHFLAGLEKNVVQVLKDRSSPAIGTQVLSLTDGHLQPGHSGAPIFDQAGRVVAIGNGGLKGGTVEIGWGIPIGDLDLVLKGKRKARLKELKQQNPVLLFHISKAEKLSFSASPVKSKPGNDLTLNVNPALRSRYEVYFANKGPLPRKTKQDGKVIIITVPGDTKSGQYQVEIRQGARQFFSSNKVTIESMHEIISAVRAMEWLEQRCGPGVGLIVPYGPGSTSDIAARKFFQALGESGVKPRQVPVNKPGVFIESRRFSVQKFDQWQRVNRKTEGCWLIIVPHYVQESFDKPRFNITLGEKAYSIVLPRGTLKEAADKWNIVFEKARKDPDFIREINRSNLNVELIQAQ